MVLKIHNLKHTYPDDNIKWVKSLKQVNNIKSLSAESDIKLALLFLLIVTCTGYFITIQKVYSTN